MPLEKLREAASLIGESADEYRGDRQYGNLSRKLEDLERDLRALIRRSGGDASKSPKDNFSKNDQRDEDEDYSERFKQRDRF